MYMKHRTLTRVRCLCTMFIKRFLGTLGSRVTLGRLLRRRHSVCSHITFDRTPPAVRFSILKRIFFGGPWLRVICALLGLWIDPFERELRSLRVPRSRRVRCTHSLRRASLLMRSPPSTLRCSGSKRQLLCEPKSRNIHLGRKLAN